VSELPAGAERSKAPTPGGIDTDAIRRSWPDILAKIFTIRRTTWTFLSEHTKVLDYDGTRLLLGIQTDGLAVTFRRGQHAELVRQALSEVLGVDAIVEGISTPQSARPGAPAQPGTSAPPATGAATSRDALSPDAVAPGHIFAGAVLPDAVSRDVVSGDAVLPDAVSHDAVSHDGVSAASLSLPAGRPTDSSLSVGLAPTGKPSGSPSDRPSTPMQRARAAVAREASTRGTGSSLLADDSMVSSDDENIEAASVGQPVISRVLGGIVISEHDQ
jgi:DNA polymerase-3 subunit gamma/tau